MVMKVIDQLLESLNKEQKEAVLENSRPLLVLAGAGSGKTRVITTKIAFAIEELGLDPYRILAVTFTNKAANEMRDRLVSMLPDRPDTQDCVVRTFHSFGAWVLRRFSDEAGLSKDFTIYDDDDSVALLGKCLPNYEVKEIRAIYKKIGYCKDKGLTPLSPDLGYDSSFPKVFESYERELRATGCVDFADLIGLASNLLDTPSVAQWAHNRFKMILVDEYQDSNMCQFNLLRKLVGPDSLVCVVGDDDQSIYSFRGAEIKNIMSFPSVFANARVIKLEQNYRSTPSILSLANSVIKNNHTGGDLKKLWTDNPEGEKPGLYFVKDERAEAMKVAQMIKIDGNYDNTAVLFRTNAQSGAFENAFTEPQFRIPYKVVGALKFYDREQVKDGLSMMYLLCNHHDVVSFTRMVNKPSKGIGKNAMESIMKQAQDNGGDYFAALRDASLSSGARMGADRFLSLYERCSKLLEENKMTETLGLLFSESGLVEYYTQLDRKEGRTRQEGSRTADFDTLVSQASKYGEDREALSQFLEQLALDSTTVGQYDPADKPGVTLITMHNTKGLEYDNVYVVGLEEGLFPSSLSESEEDIEEERRLFYVAVTRARKRLVLTSAEVRRLYGNIRCNEPSRFLKEIEEGLVTIYKLKPAAMFDDSGYHGMSMLGERRAHRPSTGDGTQPRTTHLYSNPLLHKGFGTEAKTFEFKETHKENSTKDAIFSIGDRVLSEKYGPGEVVKVRRSGGPEAVEVHFDVGRTATFISKYAQLEKIDSN